MSTESDPPRARMDSLSIVKEESEDQTGDLEAKGLRLQLDDARARFFLQNGN